MNPLFIAAGILFAVGVLTEGKNARSVKNEHALEDEAPSKHEDEPKPAPVSVDDNSGDSGGDTV